MGRTSMRRNQVIDRLIGHAHGNAADRDTGCRLRFDDDELPA